MLPNQTSAWFTLASPATWLHRSHNIFMGQGNFIKRLSAWADLRSVLRKNDVHGPHSTTRKHNPPILGRDPFIELGLAAQLATATFMHCLTKTPKGRPDSIG